MCGYLASPIWPSSRKSRKSREINSDINNNDTGIIARKLITITEFYKDKIKTAFMKRKLRHLVTILVKSSLLIRYRYFFSLFMKQGGIPSLRREISSVAQKSNRRREIFCVVQKSYQRNSQRSLNISAENRNLVIGEEN